MIGLKEGYAVIEGTPEGNRLTEGSGEIDGKALGTEVGASLMSLGFLALRNFL